jgi:hypothetical protein
LFDGEGENEKGICIDDCGHFVFVDVWGVCIER